MGRYIYNTTFVVEKDKEQRFVDWFRLRAACIAEAGMRPRLSRLAGALAAESEAQSLAFQVESDSEEALQKWAYESLEPVLGQFMRDFGPDAAYFCSEFEVLSLDSGIGAMPL